MKIVEKTDSALKFNNSDERKGFLIILLGFVVIYAILFLILALTESVTKNEILFIIALTMGMLIFTFLLVEILRVKITATFDKTANQFIYEQKFLFSNLKRTYSLNEIKYISIFEERYYPRIKIMFTSGDTLVLNHIWLGSLQKFYNEVYDIVNNIREFLGLPTGKE